MLMPVNIVLNCCIVTDGPTGGGKGVGVGYFLQDVVMKIPPIKTNVATKLTRYFSFIFMVRLILYRNVIDVYRLCRIRGGVVAFVPKCYVKKPVISI